MLHWDFKVSGFGTSRLCKLCGPTYVVTLLNWTPIFEWYMARLQLRMDTKKDTCHDEIRPCAQTIKTILGQ